MSKFFIGVEVERTQVADIIVAVEAETLEQAERIASNKAAKLGSDAVEQLCKKIDDWHTTNYYACGISEQNYDEGYVADLDLTEGRPRRGERQVTDDEYEVVHAAYKFLCGLSLRDQPVDVQRRYLDVVRELRELTRQAAEMQQLRSVINGEPIRIRAAEPADGKKATALLGVDYQALEKKALRQMAKVGRFTDAIAGFGISPKMLKSFNDEVVREWRAKFPEIDEYLEAMPKFSAETVTGRKWRDGTPADAAELVLAEEPKPAVRGFCRFEFDVDAGAKWQSNSFIMPVSVTRTFKPETWFGPGDTPRNAFIVEQFIIGNKLEPFPYPTNGYPIVHERLPVTLQVRLQAPLPKFQLTLWGKTVREDSDPIGSTAIDVRKR